METPRGAERSGSARRQAPSRTAEAAPTRQSIWALAGGKGGVGRSLLAANLGVQVARSGRRVVLVDLDLQGSNLQTYLGFQRLPVSLGDLASGRVPLLSELACETPTVNLRLVGGLQKGDLRDEPVAFVRQVAEQFGTLSADHVIIDCGSGRSPATIAAFAEASVGILVTTPEPAAVESVYLFVEAHLRWCLVRALTGERMGDIERRLRESGIDPARAPFRTFMARLGAVDPGAREEVARVVRKTRAELLLNQVRGESDEEAAASLASGFRKCFGLGLHTAGIVEHDLSVLQSVQKRRSLSQQYPNAAATKGIARAATRLMAAAGASFRDSDLEWEDLESIDHYRVLELVPKASPKEVQSAYQLLKKTYDPETTFLAPVFDAPGLREVQARIEAAYRTLIFLESRATYDRQMLQSGALGVDQVRGLHAGMPASQGTETPAPAPEAAAAPEPGIGVASPAPEDAGAPAPAPTLEIAGGIETSGMPSPEAAAEPPGARPAATLPDEPATTGPDESAPQEVARPLPDGGTDLREERERRRLTIEAIAEKTKIRPGHLQAIEEERFGDLPAAVFVRGFLREYARCLGLPAETVARAYMKRYQDWHESRRQGPAASGR